jgi:hypothetical protein
MRGHHGIAHPSRTARLISQPKFRVEIIPHEKQSMESRDIPNRPGQKHEHESRQSRGKSPPRHGQERRQNIRRVGQHE